MDDGLTLCAEQAIEFADDIRHAPKDADLAVTWMHLSRLGKAYRKQEAAMDRVRALLAEWKVRSEACMRHIKAHFRRGRASGCSGRRLRRSLSYEKEMESEP